MEGNLWPSALVILKSKAAGGRAEAALSPAGPCSLSCLFPDVALVDPMTPKTTGYLDASREVKNEVDNPSGPYNRFQTPPGFYLPTHPGTLTGEPISDWLLTFQSRFFSLPTVV